MRLQVGGELLLIEPYPFCEVGLRFGFEMQVCVKFRHDTSPSEFDPFHEIGIQDFAP
jgi:hypothetical protein